MSTLRKIVEKTKFDHVMSQDIREQCGVQPIGRWIMKGPEEWNSHV
jgi:hypothetical protein